MSKRVLVTGHRGFVGRHFYRHFNEDRHTTVLGLDIADPHTPVDVRDFFRQSNMHFDLVIHCAAVVGGRQKIDGAPLDVAVDLAIDAEMVQWALRTKPGRVVYFSSSAAYPTFMQSGWEMRLAEKYIDFGHVSFGTPDMTYGWVKLTGEYQLSFLAAEGVKTHIFRPFSGYGSDQALDYPFPSFIERAATGADPFEIWGDGNQVRDFIHIRDIVGGVLAAIDQDVTIPLNLGTGVGTSFNALARFVCDKVGYHPSFVHHLNAPVGVQYRVADVERMRGVYTPTISLDQGIEEALKEFTR